MKSIHNITTKVFKTEFGLGHYLVLLYDDKNYELYEMSRPMDANGINMMISSGEDIEVVDFEYDLLTKRISNEELMLSANEDLRTAIKIKQENFYNFN